MANAPRIARLATPLRFRSTAAACPVHQHGQQSRDSLETRDRSAARSFREIPSPRGLPLLGTAVELLRSGGAAKIHEYCDRRHRELGPIFRERLGTLDAVVISKKEYIQRVYFAEGRYPVHLVPEPWVIYNQRNGIKRGLFFMDGDQWRDRRKILNQVLVSPQVVDQHGESFNEVISDLVTRWQDIANKSEDRVVPNLETELYNWSIETLGTMVFGRRLGTVMPAESESPLHEFVHHVQQIFAESAKMAIIPPKLAATLRLPVWRRFVNAADKALVMARGYVEERICEIRELQREGKQVEGVLSQLMAEDIGHDEMVNIVADLILAAADTTSHATQWALYSLAKNPRTQQEFLDQINEVVSPGEVITESHLEKIPYAMWTIKETLRLYPIASFLTRILPQKIILDDYEIPAGKLFFMSQYTVGRDPDRFPDPDSFSPSRWRRPASRTQDTSHACMPFGFGARACIGRRVAELKMGLLLARMVQKFHLECANEQDVGIALRMITTPDQPIKIRFRPRAT